ncbi:hypothetical protein PVAND_015551 [Polypedilum vanderplanki]|uniref:Uncharacterized protein n=1 Tax=Polypedilum vanderplanki TaxID=319348 RepID=A0A9J6BDF0_POLVA|nr:hypothetical protein PVAND_015551 [Polypedilum vanderplanki]
MLKVITILFFAIFAETYSACVPYDGTTGIGYLTVCKDNGECFTVDSTRRTCINLIGGPFYKGNSGRSTYHCIIYSEAACKGSAYAVGSNRINFPWRAMSYTCPWQC